MRLQLLHFHVVFETYSTFQELMSVFSVVEEETLKAIELKGK